ncbi:MAG: class I SAM-dependent methyltransferase [Rudaea sp.]|uniref:class I SAM-dependent methyltransferase n=1 Tax=unclassified Rudaea TaxID=2627037 RepID=UPI0010F97C33|nr:MULTISPECIES: class I SAM-dependent methyltransferase [unclassified Rudaea]MBN8887377.1 class I SAM-dependent methyltransferase [Rudaea sp.]
MTKTTSRDYNAETNDTAGNKYAYDFDWVIRRYLMRALKPHFLPGQALEIGCFKGDSTLLLLQHFDDLTVVEAASDLIAVAQTRVPNTVRFIHSTIETANLPPHFEAIFLVHTLEHLDDPIDALTRIRAWLSPTGKLFVAVPNADAASRQIAVKMGLIESNQAVTDAERAHGHRCTYSFDKLEADARRAGLHVDARGGVLFKPLSNSQFDAALGQGIISDAYVEGCYSLGQQYPQLCASIYLVCSA